MSSNFGISTVNGFYLDVKTPKCKHDFRSRRRGQGRKAFWGCFVYEQWTSCSIYDLAKQFPIVISPFNFDHSPYLLFNLLPSEVFLS